MKKLFTGFCMSWGFFCFIPGPKKWDEEARPYMLAWLPTVGAIMGIIWAACFWLFIKLEIWSLAASAVLTWVPFMLQGFIHVDGFMDVSDAILSRGTLEKKRAILKDSRCGTFAIVSFVFLVLVEFGCVSSMGYLMEEYKAYYLPVILMAVPRALSGLMMMTLKPMETSQYTEMKRDKKAEAFLLIQLAVWLILAAVVSGEHFNGVLVTACACILGTLLSIFFARHELRGMNGDIAGYGILWGELIGIAGICLIPVWQ